MAELKFSIIIPSFNQGKFIERTIQSAVDQSYENVELIIIDGGSTDNTVDILKKYNSKIRYWVSEKDKGQSHAFNKGLEIASGDFIGWINSDDIYYKGALQAVNKKLNSDSRIDILFGDYDYIDESGNILHRKKEITYNPAEAFWTGKCNHANLAGFFRRKCFQLSGPLDESLHYAMDYDLYLRFATCDCRFAQIRKCLGAYRIHSGSKTTKSRDQMRSEIITVKEKHSVSFQGVFNPVFYRLYFFSSRIIKKVYGGCYSLKNILSIRQLYAEAEHTVSP